MTFYHPKYYKELRKRNTDQAISPTRATAPSRRATGPGPKRQAASYKPQASSFKRQAPEATSHKRQAPWLKLQASSRKLHCLGALREAHYCALAYANSYNNLDV